MADPPIERHEQDQTELRRRLDGVKARLRGEPAAGTPAPSVEPIPLDRLSQAFGLSTFETELLLLCVGMELDPELPGLCAAAQSEPARPFPTFGLALAVLPDAHWSAWAPEAPLRRWRLIDIAADPILTRAALKIDERVLHFLVGVGQLDARLASRLDPLPISAMDTLAPSHRLLAERDRGWLGGRRPWPRSADRAAQRSRRRRPADRRRRGRGAGPARRPAACRPPAPPRRGPRTAAELMGAGNRPLGFRRSAARRR